MEVPWHVFQHYTISMLLRKPWPHQSTTSSISMLLQKPWPHQSTTSSILNFKHPYLNWQTHLKVMHWRNNENIKLNAFLITAWSNLVSVKTCLKIRLPNLHKRVLELSSVSSTRCTDNRNLNLEIYRINRQMSETAFISMNNARKIYNFPFVHFNKSN